MTRGQPSDICFCLEQNLSRASDEEEKKKAQIEINTY